MSSLVRTLDAWIVPIGAAFVIGAAIVLTVLAGHWILGPLQQAARRVGRPTQFYLTDFVWLLIQLQASLGLVAAYVERNPAWAFYTVLSFLGGALTAMWWGAVRALSQAGVQGGLRRAILILALLPGVEATMVAIMVGCAAGSIVTYRELRRQLLGSDAPIWSFLLTVTTVSLLTVVAASVTCWLFRRLTLWLLLESPRGGSTNASS